MHCYCATASGAAKTTAANATAHIANAPGWRKRKRVISISFLRAIDGMCLFVPGWPLLRISVKLATTSGMRHEQSALETLLDGGAIRRPGRGYPRLRPRRVVGHKG